KISLRKQIFDFPRFAPDLIRITFKANVCCSNQVKLVPRNDEDRSPIAACLQVDRIRRRARKRRHDDVASLRSSNQFGAFDRRSLEHEIDPRSGSIDDNSGLNKSCLTVFGNEFDARNLPSIDSKTRYTRM